MTPRRITSVEDDAAPLWSALAFFFLLASYYIMRPVRDQLSGAVGSTALPLFYFSTFVVMLVLTPVFGALVARFPRRQLLGWSYSFFILCLFAFVPAFLAQERIGARALGVVFYVWVSVFNLFVVSLFWSFMADIFDSVSARRVFPLIALGGMAGAICGPLLTSLLVSLLGVAPLLMMAALMLGASLVLLLRLSVRHDRRHANGSGDEPIGGSLWAGIKELWTRPFLRYMAILMLFSDGIGTLAYALVADYAKANYHDNALRTAFFGHIDLAVNVLGALLQLTLTRWVLARHGASGGLLLPAIANTLLLVLLAIFSLSHIRQLSFGEPTATASIFGVDVRLGFTVSLLTLLYTATRGLIYGMSKPAVDALYTRVPRETRYKGKNFVETAVWRFGDVIFGSSFSGLLKFGVGVAGMAAIGAGISAIATWVAQRASRSPDLLPEPPPERSGERP